MAAAIENLQRFALVGFLEDLEPFVARMEEWSDRPVDVPVLNTSPASDRRRSEVTPELMAVVQEICAPSRRVYEALRSHVLG